MRWVKILQAFRYELDPNDRQRTSLAKHAGAARFAWNWALARCFERNKSGLSGFGHPAQDHRDWNTWKRENAPWASAVSKCAPQESFRDLHRAFVRHLREGQGTPRWKKKGRNDSFRLTGCVRVEGRAVRLPVIGRVRTKERTRLEGRILSATVRREADRWFVSVTVERDREVAPTRTGSVVGIDLGLRTFAVLSDGSKIDGVNPYATSLPLLRRLNRRCQRRQKGSANAAKAGLKLSKLIRRISNQRRDFLQKTTTHLAKTKSVIVIEDLNTKRLMRDRKVGPAIRNAAWGEFRRLLTYKSVWYGSQVLVAERRFPSTKRCSDCGYLARSIARGVSAWSCERCGADHDRDVNAARNLEQYGTASWTGTALVPRETPVDDSSDGGTALEAGLRVMDRRSRKRAAVTPLKSRATG